MREWVKTRNKMAQDIRIAIKLSNSDQMNVIITELQKDLARLTQYLEEQDHEILKLQQIAYK